MKKLFLKPILRQAIVASISLFSFSSHPIAINGSIGAVTEVPIGIGAKGTIYLSELFMHANFRYLRILDSYVDTLNSSAESAGYYNSATGDIISAVLSDSNYFEFSFGWSQLPIAGWFAEVGYSFVSGQGQITGSTLLEAVSDISLPAGGRTYDVYGTVSSLTLRGGYRFSLLAYGFIEFGAGIIKPQSSSTTIDREVTGPFQQAILDAANRAVDEYMQDLLKNDVIIPAVSLSWNYSF